MDAPMPDSVAQAPKPDKQRFVSSATARDGVRANLLLGLAVTILFVGGVGAWAAATSLAGAVIAAGTVVVESNVKKVQHQSGGIVGEILVREGDTVAAGDVVMRPDETIARATLQLELSRLRGESDRLVAAIVEIEGKISETKLQIIQVGEDMRKDVNEDLRDMEGQEVELAERKLVAQDQLARTTIRAPQAGIVQELAVHTVGGVIGPGETIMLIVPGTDGLVIDARISPVSIDDVAPGQPVSIRFSAFDANTTPICDGTVQRVSADLLKDPQTQISYFVARVKLEDRKACLNETKRLLPGMPAEVHIQTGERNVWSYVMKPLTDQMARAFTE
jgi:multidrug efflux pump subunit AcrA (membrane-fusion protein)